MTREELILVAGRRGYVRWLRSGCVERLRLCLGVKQKRSRGKVLAAAIGETREHSLNLKRERFECIETIDPKNAA